ncbi:MAG: hypothetical protein IPK82_16640 [Polyangiaceae bacterium]|nr:hypothetical protein [Polyangiaceae bacterium]
MHNSAKNQPIAGLPILFCAALVLAACDGNGDGGGGAGGTGNSDNPHNAAADLCVNTINDYRKTLNLPPYERWTDQELCSNDEAKSDSQTGQPHGAFGSCGESAQNECPGWNGPPEDMIEDCLALMWAEGPGDDFATHGHYINMSNPNYTQVSCGFFVMDNGAVWAVQNFK